MPFRLDFLSSGHAGHKYPHYMLYNINKKMYVKKHFKSKDTAIAFARNSIMFREKKKSKVINKNGKIHIMPV